MLSLIAQAKARSSYGRSGISIPAVSSLPYDHPTVCVCARAACVRACVLCCLRKPGAYGKLSPWMMMPWIGETWRQLVYSIPDSGPDDDDDDVYCGPLGT